MIQRRLLSSIFFAATLVALGACEVGDLETGAGAEAEDEAEFGADAGTLVDLEATTAANVSQAIQFGSSLIGTRYGWWYSGPLPKGQPMWTAAGPPPSTAYVRGRSANCTGLTNLMLRSVGKPLPHTAAGGTGGTGAYGGYYASVAERFNPNKNYPAGTLLGRYYRNNVDQGHVAVVLESGRVLQSFANYYGGTYPGVNASYTVAQSHDGGFYEYAVLPKNWLGGTGDCVFGDGFYCGGNGVAGNASTLYECRGGSPSVAEVCSAGCNRMPAGTNDQCKAATPSTTQIIVDSDQSRNDGSEARFDSSSIWESSSSSSGYFGSGYAWASTEAVSDPAEFSFYLDEAGVHEVAARWTAGSNRSASAPFIVEDSDGQVLSVVTVNQQQNGGSWQTLGTFEFRRGWNRVLLSRWTADGDVVVADAVRVR